MTRLTVDPKTWEPLGDDWQRAPSAFAKYGIPEPEGFAFDHERTKLFHLNGVAWHDATPPPKRHACWSQTYGIVNWFTVAHRCACGAISEEGRHWIERNSRTVVPVEALDQVAADLDSEPRVVPEIVAPARRRLRPLELMLMSVDWIFGRKL